MKRGGHAQLGSIYLPVERLSLVSWTMPAAIPTTLLLTLTDHFRHFLPTLHAADVGPDI